MSELAFRCHHCGTAATLLDGEVVSRRDECSNCGSDMRCCRNCRYFDPSKSNQCAESQADLVSDKAAANFCDWFKPRTTVDLGGGQSSSDDAKKAFEDLFK